MNEASRLTTTYFEANRRPRHDFNRLLRAYQASAREQGVPLEAHVIDRPRATDRDQFYVENTVKLDYWCEMVAAATSPLIVTDCDMLCIRDPRDAFDLGRWDVCLTKRGVVGERRWFNAGVVFLRPTRAALRFMQVWRDANHELYTRQREHETWKRRYGGINQAALGLAFDKNRIPARCAIGTLPCRHYNCTDSEWRKADLARLRLLHVKGNLRTACLGRKRMPNGCDGLIALWRYYDEIAETTREASHD